MRQHTSSAGISKFFLRLLFVLQSLDLCTIDVLSSFNIRRNNRENPLCNISLEITPYADTVSHVNQVSHNMIAY
ncbi:hypothetical protein F4813DRAFT_314424 [Daldinia decipiens]|uniref:uncharacterized protein n=1 Tax=Daldinia decipiens TaxID=326647 RepID=UPI0020C2584C|nr:uncharacterized protein F4813DRAFT_314424 [Daldinia decipiens]KAI1660136.1 hypothetical protein F4813DRAFT_314424 [Daldinia decipiens]